MARTIDSRVSGRNVSGLKMCVTIIPLEDDTILVSLLSVMLVIWDELNLNLPCVVDRLSSAEKVATTTSTMHGLVVVLMCGWGLNFKSILGEVIMATKSRRRPIEG
jgi:hypothetical protein